MSNKRIVIFGWSWSVHVQRWAKGMTERGYDIKVVSCGGEPIEGIETKVFPRENQFSYFKYANAARKEALKFQPDLVHVHYAGGFGLWGNKIKKIPYLLSVWGADVIDLPELIHYRYFIKRSLKKAHRISATSNLLKRTVTKLDSEAGQKTEVIPFGVALPKTVVPFPEEFGLKLCYLKGHKYKYGPDVLLEAMAEVTRIYPKVSLSIAGEGELTEKLKKMVIRLGLEKNVEFCGFIPNTKIYDFINRHHLMVMPSVMDSESFGVAVIEASACGRPVIASRVGGVPEVLVDGETGFLVKPNDSKILAEAILKFTGDTSLIETMGNNGYNFVKENYTWEKSLDMMSDLYERMTDGR